MHAAGSRSRSCEVGGGNEAVVAPTHHDRIEAYADHLGPGIYVLHYIARTVTPGTFAWPGAEARLIDRPEEFGRTASATLTVQ